LLIEDLGAVLADVETLFDVLHLALKERDEAIEAAAAASAL
jgi:hypothetical protein